MGEMENQVMTQQDEELTVKERLVMHAYRSGAAGISQHHTAL